MGKTVTDKVAQATLDSIRAEKLEVPNTEQSNAQIAELYARIDALENQLVEAFEFAANELRPLFGQGALAMVFDAVAKGLKK